MQKNRSTPWYKKELDVFPIRKEEIVTMTKNLSVMLEAGLTIPEALEVLIEQASGKMRKTFRRVFARVNAGNAFGDALEKEYRIFTPIFISSVRIGESSGTLANNLKRVADQMERSLRLKRNIQSALLYPSIVIIATIILGLGIATFILPQMVRVFDSLRVELPWTTRTILFIADIFGRYGFVITPLLLVAFFGAILFMRSNFMKPFVHPMLLKIPFVGVFLHEINREQFCRNIGTLLESGIPIQEALNVTTDIMLNMVYQKSLLNMTLQISSGQNFSDMIEEYVNLYPKMIHRMVAVGERSGGIGRSLLYLADYYEANIEIKSKNFSSVIEPILLLAIGLVVGFLAISIITPIYSITSGL